ncbi:helix-turn-helix transcriptional regulator [Rhizobium sp. RU33A]|uniref:helix-turn-helix domain-containing protein n=1 Tax=Rhizobium sp. RU33A TaxID=1907413 RepID=UPI00097061DF|nr:helix-turn-helix transcriptional regulator [Rhizobium sp. RU33A]
MEPFATNLRRRAELLGITNSEVARRAGLSDRRYGNYVTGRREPDLSTLVRIATVLSISVDELIGMTPGEDVKTTEEIFQERINAALSALKAKDLGRLAVMIEALASSREECE